MDKQYGVFSKLKDIIIIRYSSFTVWREKTKGMKFVKEKLC